MLFGKDPLKKLESDILDLFTMTKESLWHVTNYIFNSDEESRKKVFEIEEKSDHINLSIIDRVVEHLNKKCEKDLRLRTFLMFMEISAILERICDLLEKICLLEPIPEKPVPENIREKLTWMTKRVITMLEISEDALNEKDTTRIKNELEKLDDEIDRLFYEMQKLVYEKLEGASEDKKFYIRLLYVIGYLERIGDLAAKIGSRLVFIFEGRHVFIK